ncbi:glycine--tRNA ligase subunit beta [Buchnera aphidicola]|uniref:Glycine--tRNA ligase beta subunit n=1 Tax=Buchnera aphidicola (Cinara strobi) TaxID=1921549 RepID=A0A3B1E061_9GAMM|nr:glycine--tRNA ligase subunit beta [Buchnera aphidicola]VAX76345.1 Glycine--tRNA ligase beta subunit [Buchnera aphidicola (Cinara strobi)]
MNPKILLIEIQTEDLPSKELSNIAKFFYSFIKKDLKKNQINYQSISLFYTTKKIALKIFSLSYIPKIRYIKKIGPLVEKSFNKKKTFTPLALNWIKSNNIQKEKVKKITIKKKKYLLYLKKKENVSLKKVLKKIIPNAIIHIPLKKSMSWGVNTIRFSRPIRNIMVLLNEKLISLNLVNISSKNISYGHFLLSPKKIFFNHANEYSVELFKKKYIMIDYFERKENILNQIKNLEKSSITSVNINEKLLHEITASIEWPKAYLGKFKKKYLNIPEEIITYIIEDNQKYFPLYEKNTKKITNNFIFISNIETTNSKKIIQENEQVLCSKLDNINFFLKKDQKISFSKRLILLKKISFQKRIGTMYDKTLRIIEISEYIANIIHADILLTKRAAQLSKCDLTTNIITECTALQGVVGMRYALMHQEKKIVAIAIKEHYFPNFSESKLPKRNISCALSIADKIDTITGIFTIGKIPKKNKDPFALRRAAIGIIRIITKKKFNINLPDLIEKSLNLYKNSQENPELKPLILNFIYSRYKSLYLKKNYDKQVIDSVLSLKLVNLIDINKRIKTINKFKKKNNIENILSTYKRISNLLSKKDKKIKIIKINSFNLQYTQEITKYEKILIKLIKKIQKKIHPVNKIDYLILLKDIQELCYPIEKFFKNSFIYDKNIKKRSFRIFLLKKIQKIFLYITDFSYLYY